MFQRVEYISSRLALGEKKKVVVVGLVKIKKKLYEESMHDHTPACRLPHRGSVKREWTPYAA